jgi:hypothetical protein
MFSGSMGSVNAATSMLGQITSTAVSTSTSLVNNLTGTLSHAGRPTHTPPTPGQTDTDRCLDRLALRRCLDQFIVRRCQDRLTSRPKDLGPKS